MTIPRLDPPDDEEPEEPQYDQQPEEANQAHRQPHWKYPNREECLELLHKLAQAIAVGLFSPQRGNSIRASYVAILQYHERTQFRAGGQAIASEDLLAALRANPELANIVAPFLPEDVINKFFKDGP